MSRWSALKSLNWHDTAAAGILIDSLRDASRNTQVLVTSHSPDLLDNPQLDTDSILAVVADAGTTTIGQLDEAGKSALRDRLYTAGELLRLNQLAPGPRSKDPEPQAVTTLRLRTRLMQLACIVEGHGEVQAAPVLLRRVAQAIDPAIPLQVGPVIRITKSKLTQGGELERGWSWQRARSAAWGQSWSCWTATTTARPI